MKYPLFLSMISILLCVRSIASPNRLPQGGGVQYPAWTASYWSNPDFAGEPVWEQSEIRIRFDWQDWRPIIGSRGEQVRDFPKDNFSARYTGSLISRFAETYTFHLSSDEQARLRIRTKGSNEWTVLIDAWEPHVRREDSASMTLDPALVYDVEIDYVEGHGDAALILEWESPSVPREVIDYLGSTSIHATPHHMFADHFNNYIADINRDEKGWPAQDFKALLNANRLGYHGRHLLQFKGLGEVDLQGATFYVGDEMIKDKLPKGTGYDPVTNLTRAEFDFNSGSRGGTDNQRFDTGDSPRFLIVNNTQRNPDAPEGSGLTDIYLMKPTLQGSNTPHQPGEMLNGEWRQLLLPYISFRLQSTGLDNDTRSWSDRMFPDSPYKVKGAQGWSQMKDLQPSGWTGNHQWSYEAFIQMANEAGRDLHFNYPSGTDHAWFTQFAKLVKYGSDGVDPYEGPVDNPLYPPLNSNLRIILEHGNEMGWSAIQPRIWTNENLPRHKRENDAVWQALNFDGNGNNATAFKYHGYRTALMGRAMREVFGPDAMGEVVRNCLFGQYQQAHQNTSLQFIDNWFNNGAGDFVEDPTPVHEIVWGGGLAVYYGGENYWAESDQRWLKDRSFENLPLPPEGVALAPDTDAWTFSGGAGVVNARSEKKRALAETELNDQTIDAPHPSVGFRFRTGERPVYIYELGRVNLKGGEKGADGDVAIFRADGNPLGYGRPGLSFGGRYFELNENERSPGAMVMRHLENSGWMTPDSFRPAVYRLEPDTEYVILSAVRKGESLPAPVRARAGEGIRLQGAVACNTNSLDPRRKLNAPIQALSQAPEQVIPIQDFHYSLGINVPETEITLAPPAPWGHMQLKSRDQSTKHNTPRDALDGQNMAFIAGKGRFTQDITLTEPGEYMLVMTGTSQHLPHPDGRGNLENHLQISIGDQVVWEKGSGWAADGSLGRERKPDNAFNTYATRFIALEPGTYTVSIEGQTDDPRAIAYIDAVHIGTMDAYYGGPDASNFMGAGAATGQTDSKFDVATLHASAMSHNWGLVPTCYEGGNSVGGDWNGGGALFWEQSKWWHPTTKVADINAANRWFTYGGHQFFHYYPPFDWGDYPNAEHYQQWQAVKERAMTWKWEPNFGHPMPGTLTLDDEHYTGSIESGWNGYFNPVTNDAKRLAGAPRNLNKGVWKAWRVQINDAREYTLTATGSGSVQLIADDVLLAESETGSATAKVFLTQGMHSLKLRGNGDGFILTSLNIQ